MDWVCAIIFMEKKRIQFYDSIGGEGSLYLNALFQYVKDEHEDKLKCPLPNADEWELVSYTPDTQQQRHGTSDFASFIVDHEIPLLGLFSQHDLLPLRL